MLSVGYWCEDDCRGRIELREHKRDACSPACKTSHRWAPKTLCLPKTCTPGGTIAFTLMSGASRTVFRAALGVDDATWARGRGWALATGLNAYCSYAASDARVAAQSTRQITEALTG
jgi:hypothetical protein